MEGLPVAGMINCMRFRPVEGRADDMFKAMAEYIRDYPFDDIMHAVISLGDGEYALVGVPSQRRQLRRHHEQKQSRQRPDATICCSV